ncbi:MAG: DUF3604 domain-containing protein [Pseudomonadales bacterium]
MHRSSIFFFVLVCSAQLLLSAHAKSTQLFFGDTHVHTSYSEDAYALGRNDSGDPDTAYRWAKGMPVVHPYTRVKVQNARPLDFLVVADHAFYLGIYRNVMAGRSGFADTRTGQLIHGLFEEFDGNRNRLWNELNKLLYLDRTDKELTDPGVQSAVWDEYTALADKHYDPGKFTTFIGWEWSASPAGNNLHRVVFTDVNAEIASRFLPLSVLYTEVPEDLWNWLAKTAQQVGADFIAIPHNPNISNGTMFPRVTTSGIPITAEYARIRQRWEPVVEVTQIKGDSETHPLLSPLDGFADFEKYGHLLTVNPEGAKGVGVSAADYVRSALFTGLEIERQVGINPYKFGMIGSTDAHTSVSSADENNFWGKFPTDARPDQGTRAIGGPLSAVLGWSVSASGLAAAWAEENTRESILAAFRRREVYATTGPRIRVRAFGGWDFRDKDTQSVEFAAIGYRRGVPMGGVLTRAPRGKSPTFLIQAAKDPLGANLDRIQLVKGWPGKDGKAHEKLYDVALSGGRVVDASRTAPAVGNTVDVKTASYTNDIGAAQLSAVWKDPEFNPAVSAVYYLRVLEIPTPRHSLYDAVALNTAHPPQFPTSIQERAYTSPIWYTPQ